jgi:Asp-tRNA(Asn)/Glu-tRNA(Gln) amidotransferase A subunit family amidase
MTELNRMGLVEAAQAIRDGRISAVELARACVDAVHRLDPRVEAFAWFDGEHVLERASVADRERAAGHGIGPLHGVPIGVKDIFDTHGIPTECGSPAFRGRIPAGNAFAVDRLLEAGGLLFGKTVTTEFAWSTPGKTHHPLDPGHTPGGSSSGSAAGVAAGFMPAAIGTQTVGSIVRPAAFCGVVGYKPTYGLIGRSGVHPFSASLDHVGTFARSVVDAAYLAACLAGHDPDDPASLRSGALAHGGRNLAPPTTPPRLAALRGPHFDQAEPAARDAFENAIRRIAQAGARVEDVALPAAFADAPGLVQVVMRCEAAQVFAPIHAARPADVGEAIRAVIDDGRKFTAWDYLSALRRRDAMRVEFDALLQHYDAALTLPALGEAPATLQSTGNPIFCAPWSLLGVPALNLPCGHGPGGLPLGLQMVGRHLYDLVVLRAAAWVEAALEVPRRWPVDL